MKIMLFPLCIVSICPKSGLEPRMSIISSFTTMIHPSPLFVLVFDSSEATRSSLLFAKNCKNESKFVLSWKLSIKVFSHAGFNLIKSIKDVGLLLVDVDSGLRIM